MRYIVKPTNNNEQNTVFNSEKELNNFFNAIMKDREYDSIDEAENDYDVIEFKNPSDCESLKELLENLKKIGNETIQGHDAIEYLQIDMSELPIFSKKQIADTREVWSWDDRHKIVGQAISDFKIVEIEENEWE